MKHFMLIAFVALMVFGTSGCRTVIKHCTADGACTVYKGSEDFPQGYKMSWGDFSFETGSSVAAPSPFEAIAAEALQRQLLRTGLVPAQPPQ